MDEKQGWPKGLNPRCWRRYVTDNATSYAARIGRDKGMDQIAILVYPDGMDKPCFFFGLTKDEEHDVPAAVSRLVANKAWD